MPELSAFALPTLHKKEYLMSFLEGMVARHRKRRQLRRERDAEYAYQARFARRRPDPPAEDIFGASRPR